MHSWALERDPFPVTQGPLCSDILGLLGKRTNCCGCDWVSKERSSRRDDALQGLGATRKVPSFIAMVRKSLWEEGFEQRSHRVYLQWGWGVALIFIWVHQISVMACSSFSLGMWDLVPRV